MNLKNPFKHSDSDGANGIIPQSRTPQPTSSYEPVYQKRMKIEKGTYTKDQIVEALNKETDAYLTQVYISKLMKEKMLDNATTSQLILLFNKQTGAQKPSWHVMTSIIEAVYNSETSDDYKLAAFREMMRTAQNMNEHSKGLIQMEIQTKMQNSCSLLQAQRDQKDEYE